MHQSGDGCLTHAIMYGRSNGFCNDCHRLLPRHREGCPISKIRPKILAAAEREGLQQKRDEFLKQKVFKQSPHSQNTRQGMIHRKPNTRPRGGPAQEIRWCYACENQHLHRILNGKFICMECERGA